MGLTCSCDYDAEPGDKLYYGPDDYTTLATKRSRKCKSCGEKIPVGSVCAEVPRVKIPESEVEVRIYGEDGEIPLTPCYLCERCADLCFSLEELGYCAKPWEDQRVLAKESIRKDAIRSRKEKASMTVPTNETGNARPGGE